MKFSIKTGDAVAVIAGAHKGKQGKVLRVLKEKNRVVVEGVAIVKRHERKSQNNPNGAIVEREAPIHRSNVMKVDEFEARRAKHAKAEKKSV